MKHLKLMIAIVLLTTLLGLSSESAIAHYAKQLCADPTHYTCIKIKNGMTWHRLLPNEYEQELVKRLNRINIELQSGMTIAIPKDLKQMDLMQLAPFPSKIDPPNKTMIIVDLSDQAFGAYSPQGELIHWGPVSAGKDWCPDVERNCNTPTGLYHMQYKGGPDCISSIFPIPEGGAPMPYCMFFHGGYALHASTLPGDHDSHGCVRLFLFDAEWLNKEFIQLGKKNSTIVIVRP
jgi:L,D-transpeptidase ErfK/SrfK